MDVEGSCSPAPPPSLQQAGLVTVKKWQRIRSRARRALPAVCVVAATVLAVIVLSAAGDGSPTVPSSWFSVQDTPPSNLTADQLLDGLLTAEFGSRSCRSRYEFASYHDNKKNHHASHKPSPYLLAKLRRHEALQRRCGPGTAPYRAAIRQLRSGNGAVAADAYGCRYLVSISYRGLGNRMLATASAFLYAVLTERALLVHHDVGALFCEPFPGATWLLPASGWFGGGGFPLGRHLEGYGVGSKESLGNMLKTNALSVNGNASWSDSDRRPPYVYLHLEGGYGFHDKLFYCDEHQRLLRGTPWLLMKTDSYLVPSFQDELARMFPEKNAAFHHLGRYLFHPVNDVWRAVTRYYAAHLAGAGQRVGIQIRVFRKKQEPRAAARPGAGPLVRPQGEAASSPPDHGGRQQCVRRRAGRAGHLAELVVLREDQGRVRRRRQGARAPAEPRGAAEVGRRVARRNGAERDVPAQHLRRARHHRILHLRLRRAGARRGATMDHARHAHLVARHRGGAGPAVRASHLPRALLPLAVVLRLRGQEGRGRGEGGAVRPAL